MEGSLLAVFLSSCRPSVYFLSQFSVHSTRSLKMSSKYFVIDLTIFSTLFWSISLLCKQIFKLMGPKGKSRKFLATYHKSIKLLFSMLNIGNIPSIAIVTEWDRSIEYIVKLSTFTSCNDFCDFSVKKFPSNQSDVNIYSFRNPTPPRLTQLVCVWIFVYKSEIHSRTIC